jgi:hypothetical protein
LHQFLQQEVGGRVWRLLEAAAHGLGDLGVGELSLGETCERFFSLRQTI